MSKAHELRVVNTDGCFSWQQFWEYFKSDRCTDEMRSWTMKQLNIFDCISGAMPQVQVEILQYAPRELVILPRIQKLLSKDALSILCGSPPEVELTNKDHQDFITEFKKYLKQQRK